MVTIEEATYWASVFLCTKLPVLDPLHESSESGTLAQAADECSVIEQ